MQSNPYVGPRSIAEGEPLFGRTHEVEELIDLLIGERVVLLYSPSGAGKSSLLQAGVIPKMRDKGFTVRPVLRVGTEPPVSCRNRFVFSALLSLRDGRKPEELAQLTLAEGFPANPQGELVVFDQFEEVLTVDPFGFEAKREFFQQLSTILTNRGRWALFSMREDYLAQFDEYARRVPTRFANTYRLNLLDVDEAIEAIRGPMPPTVEFEDEAAKSLTDDLRRVRRYTADGVVKEELGRFVEPVQLQVACHRLWSMLPDGCTRITQTEVKRAGSIDTALDDYYSTTVDQVATQYQIDQRVIRKWFESLITKLGTRGQVLETGDDTGGLTRKVIGALIDAHLIRAEDRVGSTWLELAHDRLISPVINSNRQWRENHLQQFQLDAEAWDQGRASNRLIVGARLVQANQWVNAHPNQVTALEQDFLAESNREDRQLRRIRTFGILVAVVAVVACAGAFWALWEQKKEVILQDKNKALIEVKKQIEQELAEARRKIKIMLEGAGTDAAKIVREAKEASDRMLLSILGQTPLEHLIADNTAPGEVLGDANWQPLVYGTKPLVAVSSRTYGKGRVIAFGHNRVIEYSTGAGNPFLRTALQWVDPGERRVYAIRSSDTSDVMVKAMRQWGFTVEDTVDSKSQPQQLDDSVLKRSSTIILMPWHHTPSAAEVESLRKFVEDGGGLLISGYGWVWTTYNDRGTPGLEFYPSNIYGKPFGIQWTNRVARDTR